MKHTRKTPVSRTYYIVRLNCDCASMTTALTSIQWLVGPRCPLCRRLLGPMQYQLAGHVRAVGSLAAITQWERK